MNRIACLLALLLPTGCLAAPVPSPSLVSQAAFQGARPGKLLKGRVDLLKFQPLEEADIAMQCKSAQPPQALAMPHGALAGIPDHVKVVVNFIVGTDGQVYSPFVLEGGASHALNRRLLDEVRHWHYRPALCNGAPADAEVNVELSSR